jgi:hypothetical protein
MSWLTNRVQTARLRGKHKKTQMKKFLQRLRMPAGGNGASRFLSGALVANRGQEASAQLKGVKGEQV